MSEVKHDQFCDCDDCRKAQYPADVHDHTCHDCNAPVAWGKWYCSSCTHARLHPQTA